MFNPPLALANTVPNFLNDAYIGVSVAHSKSTATYQVPNRPDVSNKSSDTGYALSLGKEFGDYDVGLSLNKAKDSDVRYTVYADKDFGNLNVGIRYGIPSTDTTSSVLDANATTKNKNSNIGASVTYNFDKNTALTPFVSASITRYSRKTTVTNNNTGATIAQASSNNVAYGIGAGVKYEFNPNITLNGGVTYYKSNDYKAGNTTNSYDGYSVGAGIKYQF